jgi:hypothetical protein
MGRDGAAEVAEDWGSGRGGRRDAEQREAREEETREGDDKRRKSRRRGGLAVTVR